MSAKLIDIPEERFGTFLGWATDMALAFSAAGAAQQDCVDAAVRGLYGCCDELTAQRPTHPSLGSGIHYCLGNWLARIKMREALPILANRLGDISLEGPVTS